MQQLTRASEPSQSGPALVVGGTGMLRGLSLGSARQGTIVTVQGRDPARLRRLVDEDPRLHELCCDWSDRDALIAGVGQSLNRHGPFDWAVVWMHSPFVETTLSLARFLREQSPACRYFDVQGSGSSTPQGREREAALRAVLGDRYRRVILGHRDLVDGGRRWLTDDEISSGVETAVTADAPDTRVGD